MTLKPEETVRTNWWIIGGFTVFVVMLVISGAVGLFALKRTSHDIRRYMDSIDLARDIQVRLQEQFRLYIAIVRDGGDFTSLKKNYHVFSYKADRIRDDFFNLGILCADLGDSVKKIRDIADTHRALTAEFSSSINSAEALRERDRPGAAARYTEKVDAAVGEMESLVAHIREGSEREIARVDRVYSSIVFAALLLLTAAGVAMSLYVVRRLMMFHRRLEILVHERTHDLIRANRDLEKANRTIGLSEEKYRLIVEGSDALIFTLDAGFRFLTANRSLGKYFRVGKDEVVSSGLLDFIHEDKDANGLSKALVEEKLQAFAADRKPVSFTALFKTPGMIEPVEMRVRLQFIDSEGKREILGEAFGVLDDNLLEYLTYEHQRFSIASSLSSADDITYRLTRNLAKHCDPGETQVVRIGLREMIVNAIEHGNFRISFNEKSGALRENRYFQLLESRRTDPKYRHRRVGIEYRIDEHRVVYKVSDEGGGFDHRKAVEADMESLNDRMLAHGRGIAMARSVFDEIRYNRIGNQVLLVKYLTARGRNDGLRASRAAVPSARESAAGEKDGSRV